MLDFATLKILTDQSTHVIQLRLSDRSKASFIRNLTIVDFKNPEISTRAKNVTLKIYKLIKSPCKSFDQVDFEPLKTTLQDDKLLNF